MSCDHLDKRSFESSMKVISSNYNRIPVEYSTGVLDALNDLKTGWQSKKGWTTVNKLSKDISNVVQKGMTTILKDYNTMKSSGEKYARSQDMYVSVGTIGRKSINPTSGDFPDDREIIIDDEKNRKASEELKKATKKLYDRLEEMSDQTASDHKFGYYSNGDNPRAEMHKAIVSIENGVKQAIDEFNNTLAENIKDDEAARDAAKNNMYENFGE